MFRKKPKNIWLILVPIILLVIAASVAIGYYLAKPKQQDNTQNQLTNSNNQQVKNYDITATELANFFNNKFDCSKQCFNTDFKSLNVLGVYDNPLYQITDFTGDGYKDALVTIYYSGSGAMRDFYAITKDPAITGISAGEIKIVYEKDGVGFSKSASDWSNSNGGYNLTCPDSDRNGQPDCTVVINWNINSKTFNEQQQANTNKTTDNSTSLVSNIFTYKAKPGDKVGAMTLVKINHPTNSNYPAEADYVYAEFTGTVTLRGRLSAPTGNSEDAGMGPEYSLNNLTQDSLKKLPYLQSDTGTVWFGVKNQDIMKNFAVQNGDLVDMTINIYEYICFPASVWNLADVVNVKKVQ